MFILLRYIYYVILILSICGQDEERKAYYEAFTAFDWNNNGKIWSQSLILAMRRAGTNPTEVEVHDIINRHDDGSGLISFDEFCKVHTNHIGNPRECIIDNVFSR